ncbi:hypothetical protein MMC12_008058 [Toensbergia leucococca]|nr:hypothetical protein [Toensbergia leucococca]
MWYPKVPIWTVYLSGIPGLIGGNFDLGLAMLFTSYTDIMVSEAKKTTLFYLTTCMQYPAQAIGPLVSGVLIDLNGQGTTPEVALFVGFACGTVSAILTIFFFPETIDESRKAQATDNSRNQLNNNDFNGSSKENNGIWGKLQETLRKPWHKAQNSVRGVTNMFLLSVSILASAIGIKSIDWFGLVQYPVIRFHWKFSQATIAVSVQAAITMVNYALLLPFYIRFNTQHLGFSSARTSLIIMLFSTLLLIAGSIVIGFSRTVPIFFLGLVVYTLGGGLSVATQVYISSLTDKDKLARTLAGLSVATIGGKLLASGLFSKILAAGLDDGREWMKGLPLFMSACLFILAGLAIIIVSIRTGKKAAAGHVNEQSEECG